MTVGAAIEAAKWAINGTGVSLSELFPATAFSGIVVTILLAAVLLAHEVIDLSERDRRWIKTLLNISAVPLLVLFAYHILAALDL
jgi:hypothetical protein